MLGESKRTEVFEQSVDNRDRSAIGAIAGPAVSSVQLQYEIKQRELEPSYSYGTPTQGIWHPVTNYDEAKVGEIYRLKYSLSIPFLQQWQSDYIVRKINEDSRFNLRSVELFEEKRLLVIEVETIKNFSPVALVALVVAGIIAAGGLIWLTTVSIERLGTIKVGDFKVSFTPFVTFALIGLAGLIFFKGKS